MTPGFQWTCSWLAITPIAADRHPRSSTSTSSRTAPGSSRSPRFSIASIAPTRNSAARDFGCRRSPTRCRLARRTRRSADAHPDAAERPDDRAARRARSQERARRLRSREPEEAPLVKYIDHHAHMVSRTTDDYQQMALTGCVAVTEPAFWAGWDRSCGDSVEDYFRQLTEFEPTPRRAVRHPALHLAGGEPEGIRRPRAVPRRAPADPEVPRSSDGARDR